MRREVRFPPSRKVVGNTGKKKCMTFMGVRKGEAMASREDEFEPYVALPRYLSQYPPIIDEALTATSQLQSKTVHECLPLLNAVNNPSSNPFDFDEYGLPYLQRQEHIDFVRDGLGELPASFVGLDASRPWLFYWSLLSLYLLGQNLQPLQLRYATSPRLDLCLSECNPID